MPASVSKTCTVRFDSDKDQELIRGINSLRNKYSVSATAVGPPVEVHAYADRIVIRQDGAIVGEHARAFGRNQTVYDPSDYVPVLARKPGALRSEQWSRHWSEAHGERTVQGLGPASVDGRDPAQTARQ